MTPTRHEYTVRTDTKSDLPHVVEVLLNWLRPLASQAYADAYSDDQARMPMRVRAVEASLRTKGERGANRDPWMAVEIDASDSLAWRDLVQYTPWSIHVEILAPHTNRAIAVLHDACSSITLRLSEEEASDLMTELRRRTGAQLARLS